MTASDVIESLAKMGVRVVLKDPQTIKLVSDAPSIPPEAVSIAKPHKSALIHLLNNRIEAPCDIDDINDVPTCSCGRDCDIETFFGEWRCSKCDPRANHRRTVTDRLLRQRDQLLKLYKITA